MKYRIHKTPQFTIYFGDAALSVSLEEIDKKEITPALQNIAQELHISQLVFLHQNHGVQGNIVQRSDTQSQFFQQPGDYLITQKKDCGIGVVTADCLPIVIYDPTTHTAAIIHAGWKGAVAGIFAITVKKMIESCGASVDTMQIYFGPAARPCCYEVQQDFVDNFQRSVGALPCPTKPCAKFGAQEDAIHSNYESAFIKKDDKLYFDSTVFTVNIAQSLGIKLKNIYTTYNVCTICDTSFCSYRREKENARRQITLISLH